LNKKKNYMSNPSVSQILHDKLEHLIAATPPGERLPSEPDLAQQLGVSRATLREAMRTFETQGMLRRRQGSGTYVTHPPEVITTGLEVLESLENMAKQIDLQITMGELDIKHRPAKPEECQILSIQPGDQVIQVQRVMRAKDRAVAYLIDTLPTDILTAEELKTGFTGSVLDFMLRRGEPRLQISHTEINAATATSSVARAMGIQRGAVLLHFTAMLYAQNGRVIDYSTSYFLPGYFRFHVVRRVG
jgi:GntR family transcriptional regulator